MRSRSDCVEPPKRAEGGKIPPPGLDPLSATNPDIAYGGRRPAAADAVGPPATAVPTSSADHAAAAVDSAANGYAAATDGHAAAADGRTAAVAPAAAAATTTTYCFGYGLGN
jgi:hypothetical protein